MAEGNTVAILEPILKAHYINDLVDLNHQSKLQQFPLICKEIVASMINVILSEPERTLPQSTLKVIEDDLLKITRSLVNLRRTPLTNIYSISDISPMVDLARQKVSGAINEFPRKNKKEDEQEDKNVYQRIEYILQCRQTLEGIYEKLEEMAAEDDCSPL